MEAGRAESAALKCGRRLLERANQIGNRLGFPDGLRWKVHMKGTFNAQDQLGAGETVDPQIALDAA
jgi:hypothetical protein